MERLLFLPFIHWHFNVLGIALELLGFGSGALRNLLELALDGVPVLQVEVNVDCSYRGQALNVPHIINQLEFQLLLSHVRNALLQLLLNRFCQLAFL